MSVKSESRESPAETLRRAAALMRERAEAATPGPWEGGYDDSATPYWSVWTAKTGDQVATHDIDPGWYEGPHGKEGADARHIASWHPAVALAVADWLDHQASELEQGYWGRHVDAQTARAHDVAVAYLGGADA